MKKLKGALLMITVILSAVGCTKGDKVKQTTLYIDNDGKVTGAIVESLDKDYYSAKELTEWVEDSVGEYNKEKNKDALEVKKCEVEKDVAKVTITYDSLEDYSAFNHVKAFDGTIKEAEEAEYDLEKEFISAKGKPSVTYTELEGSKDYRVIIVEESQTIILEEDVLYATSNVKVKGEKAIVKTNSEELAYIIYKP